MEEYKEGVLQYHKNGEIKSSNDIRRDTNILRVVFMSLLLFAIFSGVVLLHSVALFIEGYSIF